VAGPLTRIASAGAAADPTLRTGYNPSIPAGFNNETGDFGSVNLRFAYTPVEGNWDVALFGTNLTDEHVLNSELLPWPLGVRLRDRGTPA
jgi:hypothetical protein